MTKKRRTETIPTPDEILKKIAEGQKELRLKAATLLKDEIPKLSLSNPEIQVDVDEGYLTAVVQLLSETKWPFKVDPLQEGAEAKAGSSRKVFISLPQQSAPTTPASPAATSKSVARRAGRN